MHLGNIKFEVGDKIIDEWSIFSILEVGDKILLLEIVLDFNNIESENSKHQVDIEYTKTLIKDKTAKHILCSKHFKLD